MKIALIIALFAAVARPSPAADPYTLPVRPPFEMNTVSANAQKLLGAVKPGMTRAQLDKHFGMDGGLQFPIVERHFLDDKAADGTVIMFDVAFRPAGMDGATFADANKRAIWFRTCTKWWQPADVIIAVGTPYKSRMAID